MKASKFSTKSQTYLIRLILVTLLFAHPVVAYAAEPLMVEKNLFSTERKPFESKAEEPKAAPANMAKGTIQLDGVIIRGETKKAILKVNPSLIKNPKKKGDPFVTVTENEQLGEYHITKIEPRSITVEMRGASFTVPLFIAGKAVQVVPRPPVAAGASPGQSAPPGAAGRGVPQGQSIPVPPNVGPQGSVPTQPELSGNLPQNIAPPVGSLPPSPEEMQIPEEAPQGQEQEMPLTPQ